ncbi:MAG: vitamin K epoxide reductase family protein [Nocardioidaceae bacterium]
MSAGLDNTDLDTDDDFDGDLDDDLDLDTERGVPAMPVLPWLLAVGGAIGLVSAFVLTLDKIQLLKDPSFDPSCNINPILSCGAVMAEDQAEAFGFMNPLIGLMGFAVVITVGVAMIAGAQFKAWFWIGLQLGVTFGIAFVHWLIFQTIYDINALCPYCMVVWTVTAPIFLYVTRRNLAVLATRMSGGSRAVVNVVVDYHALILILWYIGVLVMIIQHFWFFWSLGPSHWF